MLKKIPTLDITNYHGQWLALKPGTDKVVGHGKTLEAAEEIARQHGVSKPAFFRVPRDKGIWIGSPQIVQQK